MPTTSSLKLLLDLAQQRTDSAAKKLGKLNLQQQEAEKKLNLLLQYRHSYQSHFQNSTEILINLTPLSLNNNKRFYMRKTKG